MPRCWSSVRPGPMLCGTAAGGSSGRPSPTGGGSGPGAPPGQGGGRIQLRVNADEERVRLEVPDEGAQLPLGRSPSADALCDGGRGLPLLDALTTEWGCAVRPDGPGKTVWMEIKRF